MEEPDFSGIDPLRVPEARRRIAALDEYLKLPSPTSSDTQRFASSIGLSRTQFGRLARVWRDHRNARLLVIGKRGASKRDYGLDPRAVEIANDVIAVAGRGATLAGTAPEIERLCAKIGAPPPSRQTIYNHIRAARAATFGPSVLRTGPRWSSSAVCGFTCRSAACRRERCRRCSPRCFCRNA